MPILANIAQAGTLGTKRKDNMHKHRRPFNKKIIDAPHTIEPPIADVSRQPHYMQFKIQPMEFCQVNELNWCQANVVKYVCRYKKKRGMEDLRKAYDYLRCLMHFEETGQFLTPDKLEAK